MKDLIFFLKLFIPYKLWLVTGILLALLTALASISLLSLSGWFITASAIAGMLAPDGVAISFNFMQPAAVIRALAIFRTFGRYAERVVTHEATFRVLAEIRCWFFSRLIPLAPGRLAMLRSADLLSSITQDIDVLDSLYLRLCSPLFIALMGGLAVSVFIAGYSIQISLFVSIIFLILAVIIPGVFSRLARQSEQKVVEQMTTFKVRQIEILQGFEDLTVFNAYVRYKNRLTAVSEQLIKTQSKNNRLSALSSTITLFLSQFSVLVVIIIGSILFQYGNISGAVLVMLIFSVLAIFELIMPLSSSIQLLAKTQTAAKRIRGFTEQMPVINECKTPCFAPKTGDIKISDLSFRYAEKTDWVLNNINLNISQGEKIAIVGQSGTGKSSLLYLLMRFFDPQQGKIEYAGIDIKQLLSEQWMEKIAVLSQNTQLFSASIKANLLIAKPNASDSEIIKAVEMAGLTKFINKLPEGINAWVGEHGAKVSGGEGRRIALARIYLKNAPILLLDEPTEGLDYETENGVLNKLEQLVIGKTLILVTHRKAGLRLVDKTYRINEGKLEL